MKIGEIITKSPFGTERKPKSLCQRCGESGPHIDWSQRVWMGEGEMLGVVAPCECAKYHSGRWLTGGRKIITESTYDQRRKRLEKEFGDYTECFWMNEFMFPLPEPTCSCEFCEVFRSEHHTLFRRPEE